MYVVVTFHKRLLEVYSTSAVQSEFHKNTEGRSTGAPMAFHSHHSYVDGNQAEIWSKYNTKRNFSSFRTVVSELWLIFIEIWAI